MEESQYGSDSRHPAYGSANVQQANHLIQKSVGICTRHSLMIVFFFFISISFSTNYLTLTNLYTDKACNYELNYSKDVCRNLSEHQSNLDNVQILTNNYNLFTNLISNIPSAVLGLFVGGWSDRYGRRFPMIIASLGLTLYTINLLLNSIFLHWPMFYLLFGCIPNGLLGNYIVINICGFSFLSEIFAENVQTVIFGLITLATLTGQLSGTLISGQLFKYVGYTGIFCTSLAALGVCLIYLLFVMEDRNTTANIKLRILLKDLFDFNYFLENLKSYTKTRKNKERAKIWLLSISNCIAAYAIQVPMDVLLLYCKKMFDWDITTYSNVYTTIQVVSLVICFVSMPIFDKILCLRDSTIGIIGFLSFILHYLAYGLCFEEWVFYIVTAAGSFILFAQLAIRASISKLGKDDEIGKIFAVVTSLETITLAFGSIFTTQIYNASVSVFPGLIFFFVVLLLLFPTTTFLWIKFTERGQEQASQ